MLPIMLLASLGVIEPAQVKTAARVFVLLSQDAEPYQQALTGLKGHLGTRGPEPALEVLPLRGDTGIAASTLERARDANPDLLVTIGSLATVEAVHRIRDIPIVACLILNTSDLQGASNATGVVLEFPVETEFEWLRRALPGEKNVGVLFSQLEGRDKIEAAERAARGMGLTLYARQVPSPKEIPDALESMANRVGVVWGMPDPVVLTTATARPILLFSFRNRIPFVGLSRNWVKAGALYALDRDYEDIGAQCGELASKVLGGASPASLPPDTPRKVICSINLKTARMLKLDLPAGFVDSASEVIE